MNERQYYFVSDDLHLSKEEQASKQRKLEYTVNAFFTLAAKKTWMILVQDSARSKLKLLGKRQDPFIP